MYEDGNAGWLVGCLVGSAPRVIVNSENVCYLLNIFMRLFRGILYVMCVALHGYVLELKENIKSQVFKPLDINEMIARGRILHKIQGGKCVFARWEIDCANDDAEER